MIVDRLSLTAIFMRSDIGAAVRMVRAVAVNVVEMWKILDVCAGLAEVQGRELSMEVEMAAMAMYKAREGKKT